MNQRQIECFIQAATYLNFHKAADCLYISQPAMTYQIHALEAELGFGLFSREGTRVTLTHAGESFYHDCIELKTLLERAIGAARACAIQSRDRLAVAWAPVVLSREEALALVEAFRAKEKDVDIEVVVSEQKDALHMMSDHDADVVLVLKEDIPKNVHVCTTDLYDMRETCLMSASHPLASQEYLTWDMLGTQSVIILPLERYPGSYRAILDKVFERVPMRNVHYVNDIVTLEMNIASGRGVGFRPIQIEHIRTVGKGLVFVPFEPAVRHRLCAAYMEEGNIEGKARFARFAHMLLSPLEDCGRGRML